MTDLLASLAEVSRFCLGRGRELTGLHTRWTSPPLGDVSVPRSVCDGVETGKEESHGFAV